VSRTVGGDYFQALGVRLVSGRLFTPEDDSTRPNRLILDEATVRQAFPDGKAVGKHLRFYAFPNLSWEVIGVVSDIRTGPLDEPLRPTIYSYHLQTAENRMSLVVLSNSESATLVGAIRARVLALEPEAAVYNEGTLKDQVAHTGPVVLRQLAAVTAVTCASVALVLAVVGLYGVVAFTVARRNRELGIRAALGAAPRGLLALVMRHGFGLTLAGCLVGLLLSGLVARLLRALLFGVTPTDPTTYLSVALVLSAVTAIACWLPARQAVRVDPAITLRQE
jgi:ABC-type antimicrobial peptide transport system permease subunit